MVILALNVTGLNILFTLMAGSTYSTTPCIWAPSVKLDAVQVGSCFRFKQILSQDMVTRKAIIFVDQGPSTSAIRQPGFSSIKHKLVNPKV